MTEKKNTIGRFIPKPLRQLATLAAIGFASFVGNPAKANPSSSDNLPNKTYTINQPLTHNKASVKKFDLSKYHLSRREKQNFYNKVKVIQTNHQFDDHFAMMEEVSNGALPAMAVKILAASESGLDSMAKNPTSTAAGPWQTLKGTAYLEGLQISSNKKHDERYSWESSSLGAARYMLYLLGRSKDKTDKNKAHFFSGEGCKNGAIGRYHGICAGQKSYENIRMALFDYFGVSHTVDMSDAPRMAYNWKKNRLSVVDQENNAYLAGLTKDRPVKVLPAEEKATDVYLAQDSKSQQQQPAAEQATVIAQPAPEIQNETAPADMIVTNNPQDQAARQRDSLQKELDLYSDGEGYHFDGGKYIYGGKDKPKPVKPAKELSAMVQTYADNRNTMWVSNATTSANYSYTIAPAKPKLV